METISVLIPTYNVADWILESIESILKQSYENLELIIVDDYSTDGTYELLLRLSQLDSRIKLYRNSTNKKIVYTLNFALTKAKGEYIARHDGDDVALYDRLECQINYLKAHNLDLVGTQMIPINEKGEIIGNQSNLPNGINNIIKTARYSSPITHIWVAKREVYERLNGYREVPYAEDYDFILRAIDEGFSCDNTPNALMKIRHRAGNTSDVASLAQRKGALYALKLHKQRIASGSDKFSMEDADRLLKSNKVLTYFHHVSTNYLKRAFNSNNVLLRVGFILTCCLLSFYNAQYLYSRFITKRILKWQK